MKISLFLLCLAFSVTSGMAQTGANPVSGLYAGNGKKLLQFKTGKSLDIRKTNGQHYWGKDYYLEDTCIMFKSRFTQNYDTIFLKDIRIIKGSTYGSMRRLGGALLIVGGPVIGFFPVFMTAWAGGPAFLVAVPFAAMTVGGISLVFPREINATDKWDLAIIAP
ncbi:MAG TPA: hypothetical protein VK213_04450 [Bacteroidales bacterium]|nr:hypothetical protein [Bacteroidales bacterium]